MLTNRQRSFQNSCVIDTGLCDSHKMIVTVLRSYFLVVAPLKQKYIRANNGPFMSESITKAIMKRTRLRNNYLKKRCDTNKKAYCPKKSMRFISKKS